MKKISIFLLVLILILVVFTYQEKEIVPDEQQINVEECSIMQEACVVKLGGDTNASVRFNISPKGMPTTKPAIIDVSLNNIDANKITVKFISLDLDYEVPMVSLNKINNNSFNGKAFLSLCTSEKTKWVSNLVIYTKNKTWNLSFPFIHSGDGYNIIKPSF